jgi:DNA-binding response OmpR family regulator
MNQHVKLCPHCNRPMPVTVHGVTFDAEAGVVMFKGKAARLTRSEANLFAVLFSQGEQGRIATKEFLYEALYWHVGENAEPTTRILDVYVCKIRKKLPPGVKIETVWGRGWRLAPGEAIEDTTRHFRPLVEKEQP